MVRNMELKKNYLFIIQDKNKVFIRPYFFYYFQSKKFSFLFFVDVILNHNTYYLLNMKNTDFLIYV